MASACLSKICLHGTAGMPNTAGCALLISLPVTECRRPCSAWRLQSIWCVACAPVAARLIRGVLLTANLGTAMAQCGQSPLPEELNNLMGLVQSVDAHASRAKASQGSVSRGCEEQFC